MKLTPSELLPSKRKDTQVGMKKYITILIMITFHHYIANETHESVERLTHRGSILEVNSTDEMTTAALLRLLVAFFILHILCTRETTREEYEKIKEENEKLKIDTDQLQKENGKL
ncbi:uncharacterized protein ACIGJ3_009001 [Trichechus inunguis]